MRDGVLKMDDIRRLKHEHMVRFALLCAKQVVDVIDDVSALRCVDVIERWLDGKASSYECEAAGDAAVRAGSSAAAYAAYTVNYINSSAYYAVSAATCARKLKPKDNSVLKAQREYYEQLLNFDEIVEKELKIVRFLHT